MWARGHEQRNGLAADAQQNALQSAAANVPGTLSSAGARGSHSRTGRGRHGVVDQGAEPVAVHAIEPMQRGAAQAPHEGRVGGRGEIAALVLELAGGGCGVGEVVELERVGRVAAEGRRSPCCVMRLET